MRNLILVITVILLQQNKVQTQTNYELKHFDVLQVYDGIIVNIERSDTNLIEFGDKSDQADFKIYEEEGLLKIRIVPGKSKPEKAQLKIKYKHIKQIEASGKSEVWTENLLLGKQVSIILRSGAQVYADMDITRLEAKIQEGALLTATGYAIEQNISVSTSGTFSAWDLEGENGEIQVKTSAIAKVNITKNLIAKVSLKGYINYKGTPKVDSSVSLGGSIEKYSE